jgi:hypothetical protein
LPSNFGAARQLEAAKGGDPLPFTTKSEGKYTTVYLPSEIQELTPEGKETLAIIVKLCEIAGFDINATERVIDWQDFSSTLEASHKSCVGAFYCLKRDEIVPTTNIPKEYSTGWEYAQWYAFTKAINDLEHADYMSIPRVTSLIVAEGAAWSKTKQFTTFQRLSVLIRLISQTMGDKVKHVKKFLKGEGYFITKFVGKKPFGGLLLQEEFELLLKEWERRETNVKDLYKDLEQNIKLPCAAGQFKQYMSKFNVELKGDAKKIEETATTRIPQLLVTSGKGKKQQSTISKGGNLPEKLCNPSMNHTIRTAGRVMWSPLMKGVTQNQFIDLAIKLARRRLHPNSLSTKSPDEEFENQVKNLVKDEKIAALVYTTASIAANVYLEIYPDYVGNSAWDTALGGIPA